MIETGAIHGGRSLGSTADERRLTALQRLHHGRRIFARVKHRLRISQLRNNLFGTVRLTSSRHRKALIPVGQ
jgi:hypothetical protein